MSSYRNQLFLKLQTSHAIDALRGQSEDVYLECKEWPSKDEDGQRVFAKTACGFANAEGGVLVVGMRARPISKDDPDLIETPAPVSDTSAVKSKILGWVGQLVEPPIEGVEAVEVNAPVGSKSGYVVVHIPSSGGSPRRSRKDWKFYLRVGSGTFPMEYFQIADMFGRRPQPKLELFLEPTNTVTQIPGDAVPHRFFWLGLSNVGRGIAKFPSIRFKREGCVLKPYEFGLDGNGNLGLPRRISDEDWVVFRGGVDDVVYPDSTLKVTRLVQRYSRGDPRKNSAIFNSFDFSAELSAEGVGRVVQVKKVAGSKS